MPDLSSAAPPPSPLALAAATFLTQALELNDDPASIVQELAEVKEDANSAVYSVELDSSIGPAAFLVYVYAMDANGDEGKTGRELYEEGLETLQTAADRDTPGPRMVAHADTEAAGFILATTPATWRVLQGEEPSSVVASEADLPAHTPSAEERETMAEDLHRSLKEANDHAKQWLAAIRSAAANSDEDALTFTEAETALALFVLDSANVNATLNALNLLVTSAQEQAGKMVTRSQATAPGGAGGES